MNLKEIMARMAEIKTELEKGEGDVAALRAEYEDLKEKRQSIMGEVEARKQLLEDIASGEIGYRVEVKTATEEQRKAMEEEDPLYKRAFLKSLLNEVLTPDEQRAFVHTTANTGAVVPKDLVNKIYSNMEESHPILADIQTLRTGTVITIVKHTAIVAGDAKNVAEGVANDDEQNTFVNVVLSGQDISKHIDFSYRLGALAIPAFEAYLTTELGSRIASQRAKNVLAQIKSDIPAESKVATTALTLENFLTALSKIKGASDLTIYANNSSIYANIAAMKDTDRKISFIPDYQNKIVAQVLGKGIKQEDALADGEILIVDPKQVIDNVVVDLLIERDRNIKTHVHTIAGFLSHQSSMTNELAGALITVSVSG